MVRTAFIFLLAAAAEVLWAQSSPYRLAFSTYLGGASNWDQGRDICADVAGNVYVTGGTASPDFPTTPGAYDRTYNTGGTETGSGGNCDVFVAKFNASGQLQWSTYLGSPNYDRGYGIEVDAAGYVYVCGRAGNGFPVTAGAFQTVFKGVDAGIYGIQNGFVAKIKPDGSGLVWASYVGIASLCRDLAVDTAGNVYTHLSFENNTAATLPPAWFAHAVQPTRRGGTENGAIKIAPDGKSVVWATWLGGSGNEQKEANVRVDAAGNVYLLFWTASADITTTAGAYDRTHNGGQDAYIVKLDPAGSAILFATYFGGSGDGGGCSTKNLAIDGGGNTYIYNHSANGDLPVTTGTYQPAYGGGGNDMVIAKFNSTGGLVASTYLGGNDADDGDGIYVDASGNVFVTGMTLSSDFPVTGDAYQSAKNGSREAMLAILSADFTSLLYATFLGGNADDYGRAGYLDAGGNLYITGSSNGAGWPVLNAYQGAFAGGGGGQELCYKGGCYAGDVIVAKFVRTVTSLGSGWVPADGWRPPDRSSRIIVMDLQGTVRLTATAPPVLPADLKPLPLPPGLYFLRGNDRPATEIRKIVTY